jgi:hypothetical protein
VLPAASVAVAVNVWLPAARPLYAEVGLVQLAGVAASSLHVKVEFALSDENAKVALVELVGFPGLLLNVTTGPVVSTVHV